tara:strand:+ start:339 stop:515 length:177 start_codon:yes stop_codon:yes gene_type:complete
MEIYVLISMIINIFLIIYIFFLINNIKKDVEKVYELMGEETVRREIGFDSLWKKMKQK